MKLMKINRISRRNEERKIEKLLVKLATIKSNLAQPAVHGRNSALPVRVQNFNAGLSAQSTELVRKTRVGSTRMGMSLTAGGMLYFSVVRVQGVLIWPIGTFCSCRLRLEGLGTGACYHSAQKKSCFHENSGPRTRGSVRRDSGF